jgi:lipoic acid synthetase
MQKPEWFRIRYIDNKESRHVDSLMKNLNLHSVCQSAHCPNRSECWAHGTASFMVMGEFCTRGCRFCAVRTLARPPPLDPEEPENLAKAIASLNLKYVVITSVDRDDLEDYGAGHFAACVEAVRRKNPELGIEALIPDFNGERSSLETVAAARPDVISHNLETVERLSPEIRDKRADYRQSLNILNIIKDINSNIITKSGIMVGLGEKPEEVQQAMKDLRRVGVELFTIGQYLSPSKAHYPVKEYVAPEMFKEYEKIGYKLGFRHVASGPLVRSSYRAGEAFSVIL